MPNVSRTNMKPGTAAKGGNSAKEFKGTGGTGVSAGFMGATKMSPKGAASHPRLKEERAKQDRNDKGGKSKNGNKT